MLLWFAFAAPLPLPSRFRRRQCSIASQKARHLWRGPHWPFQTCSLDTAPALCRLELASACPSSSSARAPAAPAQCWPFARVGCRRRGMSSRQSFAVVLLQALNGRKIKRWVSNCCKLTMEMLVGGGATNCILWQATSWYIIPESLLSMPSNDFALDHLCTDDVDNFWYCGGRSCRACLSVEDLCLLVCYRASNIIAIPLRLFIRLQINLLIVDYHLMLVLLTSFLINHHFITICQSINSCIILNYLVVLVDDLLIAFDYR